MIELNIIKGHSPLLEPDSPEDYGFILVLGRYRQVYHFATEDLKPQNIDMTVSFLADDQAMSKMKLCAQLFDTIKKVIKCKVRFPDSWSCSQCKIKEEVRQILDLIASKEITASIRNSLVKIDSFPWLWCKADIFGSHSSAWDILLKPFPEEVARTFY